MTILKQFQLAITACLQSYLRSFIYDISVPSDIRETVDTIHDQIHHCNNAIGLRHYLLATINSTSQVWRKLAPYTAMNKLLAQLEGVINHPKFSEHNILIAQNTELHEHYLHQQKSLLRPLQEEISDLKAANTSLTQSLLELQQENKRLHLENDFLMKEMQLMFERISGKLSTIEKQTKPPEIIENSNMTTMVH